MAKDFLESLKQGVVLGDGGTEEEARIRGYGTPRVILEFPEVLQLVHQDYFRAGSQVFRALTKGATRAQLKQRGGWDSRMEEVNRAAVKVARQAAGDKGLVAGCVGPTGLFKADDKGSISRAQGEWEEQVAVLVSAGADLLVCESFDRLDEARLALTCCKKTSLPTVATVDFPLGVEEIRDLRWRQSVDRVDPAGIPTSEARTRDEASPAECARTLVDDGADVVGSSGAREPQDMWPVVREMREGVEVPIAFFPGGYRTSRPGWETIREAMLIYGIEMALYALQAKVHGIHCIGGCDGAGPELVRSMAQALGCERVHIELRPR